MIQKASELGTQSKHVNWKIYPHSASASGYENVYVYMQECIFTIANANVVGQLWQAIKFRLGQHFVAQLAESASDL